MTGFNIEDAIRFLSASYPAERLKKPSLFHSLRVCSYLYLQGYSEEICIAGLLHDAIEDTSISEDDLQKKYGLWVAGAVIANSKNISIPKELLLQDIVQRCTNHSQGALIIKSADVLDNYSYYNRCKDEGFEVIGEIKRCNNIAKMIIEALPPEYTDKIFNSIKEIAI